MEILEKLPGVTVERQFLMQGSYTLATDPIKLQQLGSSSSKPRLTEMQPESFRNSFAINRSKLHSHQSHLRKSYLMNDSKPFRSNRFTSQYQQFFDSREIDLDLHVSGKNPQNTSKEIYSRNEASQTKMSDEDTHQHNPVALKSILKRSGSAVSSRSCSILEVMSLDSGMTRLAASLTAQKNSSQVSNLKSLKPSALEESKQNKAFSRDEISHQVQKQNVESRTNPKNESSATPSKTVSFKLDPEMQLREKERLLAQSKKGEARWGVVISSFQARMPTEKSKASHRFDLHVGSSRKREIKRNDMKSTTYEQHSSTQQSKETGIEKASWHGSTPSHFQANKPKQHLTELHHFSEPYRKFLMNRALEQTPRRPKENYNSTNTISLRSYLAAAAASSLSQNSLKTSKNTGLDKDYMPMSQAFHKKQAVLPLVQTQHK